MAERNILRRVVDRVSGRKNPERWVVDEGLKIQDSVDFNQVLQADNAARALNRQLYPGISLVLRSIYSAKIAARDGSGKPVEPWMRDLANDKHLPHVLPEGFEPTVDTLRHAATVRKIYPSIGRHTPGWVDELAERATLFVEPARPSLKQDDK